MLDRITVHGARQHNLKNIDVEIPRNSFTVITGLSGSGKSSLAFDTIYAEGQRRYVETLSTYARQFLDQMERPDVDSIDGLSPAISIEQKTTSRSPRSTVGTITEIYDYLRLLYSSIGVPHCPVCGNEISRQTTEQILQHVLALKPEDRIMVMAPVVRGRKGEYKKDLEKLARQGFVRARIDGVLRSLDEDIPLDKRKNHTIEVVVDRLLVKAGHREAPGSFHRDGHQAGQRAGADRGGERRGAAVFAEAGVHGMRRQHPAAGAALVFLQQPLRRLRRVPRAGQHLELRPGQGDRGLLPSRCSMAAWGRAAGSWRRCSTGSRSSPSKHAHQSEEAVRGVAEEGARPAARWRNGFAGILGILTGAYQDRRRRLPRVAHRLHVAGGVRRLPRQAAAAGQPGGAGEELLHRRVHRAADRARAGDGAQLGARRARDADRRARAR